ncbi:MAG: competence/damage-inducible protein A [Cyclobacteriaceae bacterium]|nr:competence/damage-inducible protein A [Cyclobacteriaceae bacterium]
MINILAEIITIGDEILYGQIVDTNSKWISAELDKAGIKVLRKTTVGDTEEEIIGALKEAEKRVEIILITGGLGPTNDDLTKPVLTKYFNTKLVMNADALANLQSIYDTLGKDITDLNRKQAELPESCKMIPNKVGSASGMWFDKGNSTFVSMPGVPYEMKTMMTSEIVPLLRKKYKTPFIYHKLVKTVGIGESDLATLIKKWEKNLPEHIKLAYLPSLAQVKLRLTSFGKDKNSLIKEVDNQINLLKPIAGKFIYGYDKDELAEIVGQMLKSTNQNIAVAESCTGGYISHLITSIPGSSAYFRGGITPYQNDIKINMLHVNSETIFEHGAVSEETVTEMAENVRKLYHTDFGLATSGIAGPSGATPEKPVGMIWIAIADGKKTKTKLLQLWKDRDMNIKTTAIALLNLMRRRLLENN